MAKVGFLQCLVLLLVSSSSWADIKKSHYDTRTYLAYTLANGISVVSVRHSESPKSGYAASVGTGSLYDPIETQGLAHLLEHMLFLGTKSHPGTSSYDTFLSQHGGDMNAWTDEERTVFHNQVDNSAFQEALERFSEFFTEPLLNGTSQKKEILVVDAEHQKNVPSNSRRMWATLQFLFSFPLNHFSTGNEDTLLNIPQAIGIDIFDYLRKFHTTYYCGVNVAVATLSPLPLDAQKELVEKYFGRMDATNNKSCKRWNEDPQRLPPINQTLAKSSPVLQFFYPDVVLPLPHAQNSDLLESNEEWQRHDKHSYYWDILRSSGPIITQMKANGQYTVWLTWSLPPTEHLYSEKPLHYLKYMVGYNGRYSLQKDLVHRRWINSLSVDEVTTSFGSNLVIEFTPTDSGRVQLWSIVERVVGYINDVRDEGVDHEVLSSLAKQSSVLFSVTEPGKNVGDTVANIADALMYVQDLSDILVARAILATPNATRVQEFLDLLMPQRLIISVSDPDWKRPSNANGNFTVLDDGHTVFRVDPFYGIEHTISSIPVHRLRKLIDATTMESSPAIPREARANEELLDKDPTDNIIQAEDLKGLNLPELSVQLAPPIWRLPSSLVAFNYSSHGNSPEVLSLDPVHEIWWRGSGQYPTPRARVRMSLRYSAAETTLESSLAGQLFCTVVNDIISTKLNDFVDAGYSATIYVTGAAFNVQINGFNDNKTLMELTFLLSTAIREAMHGTTETRYQRLREELIAELSDVSSIRPTKLSLEAIRAVLLNNAFLREDILAQLSSGKTFATYDTVATRVRTRLRSVHTTVLTMGLSKKDTIEIVRIFLKESGYRSLPRRQAADSLTVDLTSPLEVTLPNPIPNDSSNVALLFFRTDFPTSIEDWVETQILANMFGTKVMEQLRTVEQLGYSAGASITSLSSLLRVVAYVEGPRKSATDEMAALEKVIAEIGKNLSTLHDSELQRWRMALQGDLSVTLINSDDEHNRLWLEIEQGLYCFQRRELQSQYLNDESIWNNSATLILSKAFDRLTRSTRSVKLLMHAPSETQGGNISTAFLKFGIHSPQHAEIKSRQLTLSSENITEFQRRFGFLPISSICGLSRNKINSNFSS